MGFGDGIEELATRSLNKHRTEEVAELRDVLGAIDAGLPDDWDGPETYWLAVADALWLSGYSRIREDWRPQPYRARAIEQFIGMARTQGMRVKALDNRNEQLKIKGKRTEVHLSETYDGKVGWRFHDENLPLAATTRQVVLIHHETGRTYWIKANRMQMILWRASKHRPVETRHPQVLYAEDVAHYITHLPALEVPGEV